MQFFKNSVLVTHGLLSVCRVITSMKANSTIFWTKTGTELSSPLLFNHTVFVAWALNVMCYIFLPSNTLPLYLIIFFQGKNMELYSERDRGRGYKFKWESGALHFRKMARVGFSRRPTLSHVYLESKWVIGPLKCQLLSFFYNMALLSNNKSERAMTVCVCLCV